MRPKPQRVAVHTFLGAGDEVCRSEDWGRVLNEAGEAGFFAKEPAGPSRYLLGTELLTEFVQVNSIRSVTIGGNAQEQKIVFVFMKCRLHCPIACVHQTAVVLLTLGVIEAGD